VARVVVDVMLKPEILDPAGQAVANALPSLGVSGVDSVRIGKRIEIEFTGDADLDRAREIADKLLANPVIEDFTLHVVEDGRLVQAGTVLESEKPLLAATKIEPWMLSIVAEFTGGRSAGEVHERSRQSGALPEGFGTGDFAAMVGAMIERGYLNIDGEIIGDTQRALQP